MPPAKTDHPEGAPKARRRLTKEKWLEEALNLLEKRGPAQMNIDSLTSSMGVTTGSFYHHFKSHSKFLEELTDKYIRDYTTVVEEHISTLELPARDRLIEAMRLIITSSLGGMDVHFRALAMAHPHIAVKIREMDDFRTNVIKGLFEATGYRGDELLTRVHIFVVTHSMEALVSTTLTPEDRLRLFDERVKLLID
ncbi:MAG: TetR/AcrR family transcriptional regulator [Halioglobus sp.]